MMDVEELLRETLNDPRRRLEPVPGMFETVRERARQRRQRVVRLASAMTVVVLIAGVATAIGVRAQNHTKVAAHPSITPSPQTGQATPINLGQGSTTSFALTPSEVFVGRTDPSQLVEVSPTDVSIIKRIATPDAIDGIAADPVEGLVWRWSSSQPIASDNSPDVGSTTIRARTTLPGTVTINAPATVPAYTFSAAALDGDLWLATPDGLYVVTLANASWRVTKLVSGSVFSVAADAVRDRILYGSEVSTPATGATSLGATTVHEIDASTRGVIGVGPPLPIGKESIAIVGDQIWVAGYGSGSTPRLFHLDGSSLQTLQTAGFGAGSPGELGPGAIVWPGASVLWVRSGGSEALACVDPQSGALLEQWDAVQGPVASVRGHAYAASDGSLDELSLSGDCTG
jgi:hypothetical protein